MIKITTIKSATQMMHWPGKDSPACDDHAEKMRAVGFAMGFYVSSTPCDGPSCANCMSDHAKEIEKRLKAANSAE